MTSINTSYWFLSIGGAIAAVLFLFLSGWPLGKHPESARIALWSAAICFAHSFMGSMLLEEFGWYQRTDGVEYNYMRGIVFTISALVTSSVASTVLWHESVLGWALVLFGTTSVGALIGMGLSTSARVWWWLGVNVVVPGIVAVYIKIAHAQAFFSKHKTQGQKIFSVVWAVSCSVVYLLFAMNQLLAPEGNNNYDIDTREWFDMALSFGIMFVLLFAVFVYEPIPAALIQEGYGPVPGGSAVVTEGDKPAAKTS